LWEEAVLTGREQHRYVPVLWLHPLLEPLSRVANAIDARKDLENLRLLRATVSIVLTNRVDYRLRVVEQDALEREQPPPSLVETRVGVAEISLALEGEDALRLVFNDFDSAELGCLDHKLSI